VFNYSQVASVNRGLDRCAALLKSLISPGKEGEFVFKTLNNWFYNFLHLVSKPDAKTAGQTEDKGKENVEPANALSRKLTTMKTTSQSKHLNKVCT